MFYVCRVPIVLRHFHTILCLFRQFVCAFHVSNYAMKANKNFYDFNDRFLLEILKSYKNPRNPCYSLAMAHAHQFASRDRINFSLRGNLNLCEHKIEFPTWISQSVTIFRAVFNRYRHLHTR